MRINNINEIKIKVLPALKKAGVKKSSLFGSYVRGEQGVESDIDILVDFPRGKGLFEFAGLQMELEKALGKKVDLLTYNSISPLIRDQILAEEVLIYEER